MVDKIRFDDASDEYVPTDSEDNYDDEEQELLQQVKDLKRKTPTEQRELLRFDDSSDEEDDDDGDEDGDDDDIDELMGDSDIEGAADEDDDIPDAKDWGKKSRNYYHTDFVDQDYSTYNAEEEEMALQEEEEAKLIQLRLANQMKDDDFLFDELCPDAENADVVPGADEEDVETSVKADLAGLTKRERQQMFHKQSPEFTGLMTDMKHYLSETRELLAPVMSFVRQHDVPVIPGLKLAHLYQDVLHTYCCNIAFYLMLKSKCLPIRNHPVIKRLVQLKKFITQLQEKYDHVVRPQLENLLKVIKSGEEFSLLAPDAPQKKKVKKTKLNILDKYETESTAATMMDDQESDDESLSGADENGDMASDSEDSQRSEVEMMAEGDERRGITYQIAKNKGLMPHRKKEQRNPRVKHRSKFRKALIRRKGAIRTVRTETKRYGGEMSGIKAGVIKSVKFKS